MSDTIWQALADAYIKGAQGVHDDHAKVIDWKAEAAPIAAEHRDQVIRELIEKAEAESPYISMDDLIDGRDAFAASVWLKAQMEGE